MFKKATNFLKRTAKKAITSERLKTMALMLVVGTGIAMAQNSAGDYSAGTTALTTVTEEIAKYVPIVVKLCYAIAGCRCRCHLRLYRHEQRGAGCQEEDHDDRRCLYLPRCRCPGSAFVLWCN